MLIFSASFSYAGSPLDDLKTEKDKIKFVEKQFEVSMSHKANAGQTQNAKMSGVPIDKPELYKDVKKIAVLGLSVKFSADGASEGEKGYGGIPFEHFDILTDSILSALYMGFESEGFQIVRLDAVMKASSYSKLEPVGVQDDCRITTPFKSKWVEPEKVNSIGSGISFVHKDTIKARAMKRNQPYQDLVKEVGADAGINVVVRIKVSGGEFIFGGGPMKRGLVIDMIPATGDPRIIWSTTLKADLKLDLSIGKFDKKSGLYDKSWKYDLKSSVPYLSIASRMLFVESALKLKIDQVGEK
jgi:hypothetical protein